MSLNHTHDGYDNFVLEQEIEDQVSSHLNLMQFCTIDNSLEGTPGMQKTIRVYNATDSTQVLAMGAGNTLNTEVDHTDTDYTIQLYQNRFPYYDEELMKDPMIVQTGTGRLASGMYNKIQSDIMTEFGKATKVVYTGAKTTDISFDNFADAIALLGDDSGDAEKSLFGLVHPNDVAKLRKKLKDDIKYVEAFVRHGYIGTICGVNLYTYKNATEGTIVIATKKAVTYFSKKGTEVEQGREENTRLNTIYSRKYGIPAFTDANEAVKIIRDAAPTPSAPSTGA